MPSTYTPIISTTLSSNQSDVTFSTITGVYTDLVLSISSIDTTGPQQLNLQLNGNTSTDYSNTRLIGDGSSAASNRGTNETAMNIGFSTTAWGTSIINFMNYSNTTTFKTVLSHSGQGARETKVTTGLWRQTSAITSIRLFPSTGSFVAGSTFTLYGIKAA